MQKNFFIANFLNDSDVRFARNQFEENFEFEKIQDLESLFKFKAGRIIFNNKLIDMIEKKLELRNLVFFNLVKIFKRTQFTN